MKDRNARIRKLSVYAGLLALLLLTCVFLAHFGVGIPCMFYQLTGFYCPGCGITRMGLALLHGDVAAAWRYNPAVLLLLPLFLLMALRLLYRYVRTGSAALTKWENRLLYAVIVFLLLFGVLRNLPCYPY